MHAWWEAWRSSVPGCLVDSVLEHLVERGDCLHMHVHGWEGHSTVGGGGFGNS